MSRFMPQRSPGGVFSQSIGGVRGGVFSGILCGGQFTGYDGTSRYSIARLNTDGTLDTTFDPGDGFNFVVSTLALDADGKILCGGNFTGYDGTTINRIARLNADGTLDTTFDPGDGFNGGVSTLALDADGKILCGGDFTTYDGTTINRIARLNADGTLDTTFDPGDGFNGTVDTLAEDADGKILCGGYFTEFDGTTINRIARLNADGTLDTTFDPGDGFNGTVDTLAEDADGKILCGGNFTGYDGTTINRIARLNTDGTLDTTFDPGDGFNAVVLTLAIL